MDLSECIESLNEHQSMSRLYKVLTDIRKNVDVEHPKYKENISEINSSGALKKIVRIQNTLKRGVVGVTLSILGNCCLNARCATDLICQYHIFTSLHNVVKQYEKEDSVNGRVFRIIGNLCQQQENWAYVIVDKKPQLIQHLVDFVRKVSVESLDEKRVSLATVTMAIRALRVLVKKETISELIDQFDILKTIGTLLNILVGEWERNKQYESILSNMVRLLLEYSHHLSYQSIGHLRRTDNGDGLLSLVKILQLSPKQITKMFIHFVKISQLKSDLPIAELFDAFVKALEGFEVLDVKNEEYIRCLCHFLEHPVNRANDRCRNCIPVLISILDRLLIVDETSLSNIEISTLLITTLDKCKHNENLIIEQLRSDIIAVLERKLAQISTEDMNVTETTEDDNDDAMLANYNPQSPASDSEMALSFTSGLSPRSQGYGDMSDTDSDDYSPVCSDDEPEDYHETELLSETESNMSEGRKLYDMRGDSRSDKKNTLLLVAIVDLLRTYLKVVPQQSQLGSYDLVMRLIHLGNHTNKWSGKMVDYVTTTYLDILEIPLYFLSLVQTDLIPIVYNWKQMRTDYNRLKSSRVILSKVNKVAESGYVFGEIAHKLTRGDVAERQKLVLVIPYIVSTRPLLSKLMVSCGGLDILMDLILADDDSQKSIDVLCALACQLRISNPQDVLPKKQSSTSHCHSTRCHDNEGPTAENVTFQLDDGSLVTADRSFLSEKSDFFERLFNSDFRESRERTILLHSVLKKSLETFLYVIRTDNTTRKGFLMNFDFDLDTFLDVIALCDRFLMPDLCNYLTECVEKYKLNSYTIPVIYKWSIESGTNLLRVESVAYALVSELLTMDRIKMFRRLFRIGYKEELLVDIKQLLERYLTLGYSLSKDNNRKRKRK